MGILLVFQKIIFLNYTPTLRNVSVNVNGERAKLLIRETEDGEITRNCDCHVVCYAINDRDSFGKYKIGSREKYVPTYDVIVCFRFRSFFSRTVGEVLSSVWPASENHPCWKQVRSGTEQTGPNKGSI